MFEHGIFGPDVFLKLDDGEHKNLQLLEGKISSFLARHSREQGYAYKGKVNVPLDSILFGKISIPGQRMLIRVARNAGWRIAEIHQNNGVLYLRLKE